MRNRNHFIILICFFMLVIINFNLSAQILRDTCIISRGEDPDIQVGEDSNIYISWGAIGENPNVRYTYFQQFDIKANPLTEPIKVSEMSGVQRILSALGKERLMIV